MLRSIKIILSPFVILLGYLYYTLWFKIFYPKGTLRISQRGTKDFLFFINKLLKPQFEAEYSPQSPAERSF